MDKTGTLAKGEPAVTDVLVAEGVDRDDLLRLVAAVERESEHPLAEAIVRHADAAGLPATRADRFDNVPGHGAIAVVDGRRVVVANRRLLDREGIDPAQLGAARDEIAAGGRTAVLAAIDGAPAGLIGIAAAARHLTGCGGVPARTRRRGGQAHRRQPGHR